MPDQNKTVARELQLADKKLHELDEARDEFISLASHQLRTPLTSVKGYISMILDGDAGEITDLQRKFLQEAFDSSERMSHVINDFLNVSRLGTGKFELERERCDIGEIVQYEVDHLQTTAGLHGLRIQYKQVGNFDGVWLDKSKLQQVVMNFIDNAIFYGGKDKTIDVSLERHGDDAVLKVRDYGIGVPAAEQAELFNKFFRAHNARRQRPDGTGVGLYLAQKVIREHGGSIVFDSVEGKGSTFGFVIPLPGDQPNDLKD